MPINAWRYNGKKSPKIQEVRDKKERNPGAPKDHVWDNPSEPQYCLVCWAPYNDFLEEANMRAHNLALMDKKKDVGRRIVGTKKFRQVLREAYKALDQLETRFAAG